MHNTRGCVLPEGICTVEKAGSYRHACIYMYIHDINGRVQYIVYLYGLQAPIARFVYIF